MVTLGTPGDRDKRFTKITQFLTAENVRGSQWNMTTLCDTPLFLPGQPHGTINCKIGHQYAIAVQTFDNFLVLEGIEPYSNQSMPFPYSCISSILQEDSIFENQMNGLVISRLGVKPMNIQQDMFFYLGTVNVPRSDQVD